MERSENMTPQNESEITVTNVSECKRSFGQCVKHLLFGGSRPILRELFSLGMHFLSLLGIDVVFRYIYAQNNTGGFSFVPPTLFSVFWALLLASVAIILPRLARRIYIISTTFIFGFMAILHGFFSGFFGHYMSFSAIMFAGDGAAFFDWSYFGDIPKKFIAVVLLCIFVSVFAALILPKTKRFLIRSGITLLLAVICIICINLVEYCYFEHEEHGYIVYNSSSSIPERYEDFTDYKLCMHMCGLYQYTFRDIYISTGLQNFVDKIVNRGRVDELDEYYSSKVIDEDNEMTGKLSGKDLLVIQLESIDTWMINDAAMPTLNAVREQSVDFTQFYAPKYLVAATFNSENVVNTGTISPLNSSRLDYFRETYYPYSLPNLFKNDGYVVNSYHRSSGEIYNRGSIHTNWGYESYNSHGNMQMSEPDMDSSLMDAFEMFCPNESYMSFIITYTGHGPYTAENEVVKRHEAVIRERVGNTEYDDEYIYALCHAYETDLFVKALIERLEAEGRLQDTAILFYTDHYDHYVTGEGLLEELKGTDDTNLMCHVPCFIYSPVLEAQKVDKVIATYDILPTIVNLFGFDNDGRYYFGNDAFSKNGGYVIFKDRSWYDGKTYYKIDSSKITKETKARNEEISERLDACWDTVKYDYFRIKE